MLEINLPSDIVKDMLDLSSSGKKTEMKNVSIIEEQDKIKNIVSKIINTKHYFYGNIFNHTDPFCIHSDISTKKKSILLIPIQADVTQTFIVFDQILENNAPMSWIYNVFDDKTDQELKEMYYESSLKCRPYDTPEVKGCLNKDIDDILFDYLPYSKELYYGLTGRVWHYKPGKALLFDANRLHATGKMKSPKIGCTIQFTETIDNLEILKETHILP